jgi:integrase
VKLSNRSIAALIRPADKDDVVFWDDTMPGFGIRLRGDRKTFLIQYRIGAQQRRESLGDVRRTQLEDARRAARQRFARVELGHDPAAERAGARAKATATRLTLGVVSERYLDARKTRMRPATYRAAEKYFHTHWEPLRQHPIESIKRAEIAACLQVMCQSRGRTAAARARANLSALFSWSMREGFLEFNPVLLTNDPGRDVAARNRLLAETELATIWRACQDDDFGRIVRLLMLLGCRRCEIGSLGWRELDLDRGIMTIAAARTKNGRALVLPLPQAAISLLQSIPRRDGCDSVFGSNGFLSWSAATAALKQRIAAEGKALAPWTLHDLRRALATHMAEELGVQPHIIEAILNHVSGHKSGPAGVYNLATYQREVAAALGLWAEHVAAIVEGRKSKLVPFRA